MKFRLLLTGCLFAAFLGACGFQPMYGTHTAAQKENGGTAEAVLATVEIGNIPDRTGLYLRNALIDRFYSKGTPSAPRYTLQVSAVKEVKRDLDLTKSSEATRYQLNQSATFTLFDRSNPSVPLLTRSLISINSYNVLESEFATRVTEDAARLSGLNDLARQIELNLTLYLNQAK